MKVTGVKRDDGLKDYQISHGNKNYTAVRSGSLFVCNGIKGTLREIKDYISSSKETAELEPQPVQERAGTWDSVDPCALLVLLTDPVLMARGVPDAVYKEVSRTLCNYGWKTDDGFPDRRRADREMCNFRQKETGEF